MFTAIGVSGKRNADPLFSQLTTASHHCTAEGEANYKQNRLWSQLDKQIVGPIN